MAGNDGAISIYAVCMRLTALNADGSFSPGNSLYITDTLMQLQATPNVQSGDDLTQLNAAGNLCGLYHHGDMIKRYDLTMSICAPDPELETMIVGGTLLTDNTAALSAPAAPTVVASTTGGTLPTGTNKYSVSAVGRYGETLATPQATTTAVTGPTGSAAITWTTVTGAVKYRVYGRSTTQTYLIAEVNAPTLTYTDTGSAFIGQGAPTVNNSAGPGTVGQAAPALGKVGNPNGFSIEVWSRAILNGNPASTGGGPYIRWVLPWSRNWRNDARTWDNTIFTNQFVGEAQENTQWSSGPRGDWPLMSSQVIQRGRESSFPTPSIGVQTV